MKLLVCISSTPDTTAKIEFVENNTQFKRDGVSYILNPYDEWYALVRAIELKNQLGGTVTVIHVGDSSNDSNIRKSLAIGADNAIRIDDNPTTPLQVAKLISSKIKDEGYDLIFTGKETIDYSGASVGAMIAELLDLPFLSFASHLDHDGSKATVTVDIEGGVEVVEVEGPFVVSAAKGMAEQLIPNMRGIMMAKKKPLEIVEAALPDAKVSTVNYSLPPAKTGVKLIDPEDIDTLVRLLHEEAKVI